MVNYSNRVPAIVHWPNQVSPGKENGMMSTLDVLPTVMGSFGLKTSMLDNVVMDGCGRTVVVV